MTKAQPKLVLSASRNIPFNQLVLSQANVRRIKAGVSVEELAEDIARRTLLQSLNVRLITKADGTDTGLFEIPAGGRRYRALELLVKQKRLAKDALVPCIVRTDGLAEEDSLAENLQRAPLHPLDQFRAFLALREAGLGEEEIAARFFVTPAVVRQRLKLAAVSPKLLDGYAEDEMTLEQLMAFTVTADHARQEQIWGQVTRSSIANPYHIRRLLTESAVAASDKGDGAARLIEHLKKSDMAREAERLLAGTGWLPEPLRMPEPEAPTLETPLSAEPDGEGEEYLPEFLAA